MLRPDGTGLMWTVVTVPFDPKKVWPQRKGLRVRGTIRGVHAGQGKAGRGTAETFAFRTSLFRARDGEFILLVNKQMQKGAGVTLGSVAEIVLEPDLEERPATTPPELEKLLRQSRGLKKFHDELSDSMRKAIADLVQQPRRAEARAGRAELWAERMMLAMEGERVTPPILEAAFQRQPKARDAWRAMTRVQRRSHLLGIFFYQSPESRQKRAQKAVNEAMRLAEKKTARDERDCVRRFGAGGLAETAPVCTMPNTIGCGVSWRAG
ncbi:MAG: YdeI/OmpD-associated family protein [Acidobacteriaceae bacterium]